MRKINRVRVGKVYEYRPVMWDVLYPTSNNNLENGDAVKVVNLSSAPPANTAGHCYVVNLSQDLSEGQAILVHCNSLV